VSHSDSPALGLFDKIFVKLSFFLCEYSVIFLQISERLKNTFFCLSLLAAPRIIQVFHLTGAFMEAQQDIRPSPQDLDP
jgi:hypothetical protein